MSKKKSKSSVPVQDELRIRAFSRVKYANKALSLLETLTAVYTGTPPEVKEAFTKVRDFFVGNELRAYRDLFTLICAGAITDTEDQEAAKMAIKRFLAADMSIMHLWTHDGNFPGAWMQEDENKVRECFRELELELVGRRKYSTTKRDEGKTEHELMREVVKKTRVKKNPPKPKPKPIPKKTSLKKPVQPVKKNVRTDIVREKPVKKSKKR